MCILAGNTDSFKSFPLVINVKKCRVRVMDLTFPEKAPATREEFLAFIELNLDSLKFIAAQNYLGRLSSVHLHSIVDKFKIASQKYGPQWQGLFGIDPIEEGAAEILDHLVYTAWESLQVHFSNINHD